MRGKRSVTEMRNHITIVYYYYHDFSVKIAKGLETLEHIALVLPKNDIKLRVLYSIYLILLLLI